MKATDLWTSAEEWMSTLTNEEIYNLGIESPEEEVIIYMEKTYPEAELTEEFWEGWNEFIENL